MHSKSQYRVSLFRTISCTATAALAMAIVFALTVVLAQFAQTQTFQVIHDFTGGRDGSYPAAGLTMDRAGNLYGTTYSGGTSNHGTAFKLSHTASSWVMKTLYSFQGGNDGWNAGQIVLGPDGSLYGTTQYGGVDGCYDGNGCGTVYNLKPPAFARANFLGEWLHTVLYRFTSRGDGMDPSGAPVFDQAGNLYGTTLLGGRRWTGLVYQLSPSGGGWDKSEVYSFDAGSEGGVTSGGVIFDQMGNLYGTNQGYGNPFPDNCGTVYQLTPSASGWTENTLYTFDGQRDGGNPLDGLIRDHSGNFYGITGGWHCSIDIVVFMLTPSSGEWIFTVLYNSEGGLAGEGANLSMDAVGNLYGTIYRGGAYTNGGLFKLTRSGSSWTYTDLHDFTTGSDGGYPAGKAIVDASGKIYGTAEVGGAYGGGVIWEITP